MSATEEAAKARGNADGIVLLGSAGGGEKASETVALPRLGLALLAFLQLDCPGGRASREEAGAFLWEEVDHARQAGNLRQMLFRIHVAEVAADMQLLETTATEIVLNPRDVSIDLRRFQAAVRSTEELDVVAVCEAYGGDLLAGLTPRGKKLEIWLARKRAMLRAEFFSALTPYVEAQANGPVDETAIIAALRILEIDPREDVAYRALIQAYQERGDAERAEHYRRQRDHVRKMRVERWPAPVAVLPVDRALKSNAPIGRAAQPAANPSCLDEHDDELPRAIVSPHAPSYAPAAGRELVVELGADITTRLAQTRALTVIAGDPPAGDKQQEADYLVEVRLDQGRIDAIQLRLLALRERQILWVASFADSSHYFERAAVTQNAILRHIEDREISLGDGGEGLRAAYRLTLKAKRLLNAIDLPSIRRARRLLKSAQALVPDFVPTIAALARSHVMEWLVRAPFEETPLEFAEQFAKQAIAVNRDDYRGYHELGLAYVYRRRLDDGIECFNRAMSLCPEGKGLRADLADALVFNGQAREAIALLDKTVHSFDPADDYTRWVLAGAHFALGDYTATLAQVMQMSKPAPAFRLSAAARALSGDVAGARRVMKASMDFNPNFDLGKWLTMLPCRNDDHLQRYTDGLLIAGFQLTGR
jgi:DNA-binding SARP family transcriptional activator/Flp pilus assembly protein TadD